jgi:hypothetical protein
MMIPESNKINMLIFFRLFLFNSVALLIILFGYQYNVAFGQLANKTEPTSNLITNNNTNVNSTSFTLRPIQDSLNGQENAFVGFVTKGTINSVTKVPNSKWVATGDWHLTASTNSNVTVFEANTTWYNSNGTSVHTHELHGLREYGKVTPWQREPGEDIVLNGVTDIRTNNLTWWNDVPISISIKGHKVVVITIDDNMTNHHFVGQPILGIVSSFLPCSDLPRSTNGVLVPCGENASQGNNSASSNATMVNIASDLPINSLNTTFSRSIGESKGITDNAHSVVSENNLTSQAALTSTNISLSSAQDRDQKQPEPKQSSVSESVAASKDVNDKLGVNNRTIHDYVITYENTTDGIRINYPSEWRLQQGRMADPTLRIAAKFYPDADNKSPFTIAIRDLTGNVSVDSYANATVNRYTDGLDEFTRSHFRTNTTLSGYHAYDIGGTYIDEVSVKNQLREVGTILNNTAYILQFSSAEYKFPSYLTALEEMIDSFQIIPIATGSDNMGSNKTKSPSQLAVGNITIPSKDNGPNTNESGTGEESMPSPTNIIEEAGGQDPTLKVTISTANDISLRGQDQTIYVDVLDSSSNIGVAESEIDGIIVDGEDAEALIADSNNTNALLDLDIDEIDGEEFSGETDGNGQLIESVEIPESFEEGNLAIVITADADGYDPVSKIAASTLQ